MSLPRIRTVAAFSVLTIVSGFFAAFAQTTDGNITGSILDPTGASVANATVTAQNLSTGIKTPASTDGSGIYRLNHLPVGTYNLSAASAGFSTTTVDKVDVSLNVTSTVNITLQVGNIVNTVEVTAAAPAIDTTTAQVANTYATQLASELPLAANPNGGIYNLSLIGAGVASSGGVGVGTGPSVGGQRPRNNNFTVEGVDNNSKSVTGPVLTIPNDGVAELSVLQNQFSAEFGHSSGGQFNVVVKSGTNSLHGGIYDYLQNRNLNANDQSNARTGIYSPPRYDQNHLGGEVGGPVVKNKLFLYGLFEYNPIGQAATSSSPVYAPTAAGYSMLDAMSGISKTNLAILKQFAPATAARTKDVTVNGALIPVGILPIVAPSFQNNYNWLVSADYNISDRDQIRARYIDNKQDNIDTAATLPVFFYPQPTTAKLASVSEFHNFRPNLTNELRLAFNRLNSTTDAPANFNYPGLDVFPNVAARNDLNLNIGPDPNSPQSQIQNVYQLVDNVSWIKGRHELKFGFDGRDLIASSTFIQRVRGDYEWTTLQGFLNDTVPDYIAQRNVGSKPYSGNDTAYYAFANDNFRWSRNLSINLGVRYEFNGVAQSMREFGLNSIADVPGVLVFRAPEAAKKNFAPRVGFAYSPGASGSTSIRGGFSLAYDQIFDNVGTNARPPQATSTVDVTGQTGTNFLANGGIPPSAAATALTQATARANTSSFLPANQQLGYAVTWNLGIQHSFAKDYTFEVRYLGNRGIHLLYQNQINRNALTSQSFNLPTYLAAPSQATLDALTVNTATFTALRATSAWNPLLPYGFTSAITAYVPRGNSSYHGLATEFKKRWSNDLLFVGAYTWSHLLDDSTAEVNSIVASPRRPQDFNNISAEKANSALDRRHRFTFTSLYDTPWLRHSNNYIAKNIVGGWQLDGTLTIESGEWATAQSGVDANQNGDAAGDRVIINPAGTANTGSAVTALKNTAGQTVAYLAANPNARYIAAGVGAYANGGRNNIQTPGIRNVDFSIAKSIKFGESRSLQLRADMYNALNHPQYILGRINNVRLRSTAGSANWFIPGNPLFEQWDQSFSSNSRVVQVVAKFLF